MNVPRLKLYEDALGIDHPVVLDTVPGSHRMSTLFGLENESVVMELRPDWSMLVTWDGVVDCFLPELSMATPLTRGIGRISSRAFNQWRVTTDIGRTFIFIGVRR